MTVQDEYDLACAKWILHDDMRDELYRLMAWWNNRDIKLREEVAELAGMVYRGKENKEK